MEFRKLTLLLFFAVLICSQSTLGQPVDSLARKLFLAVIKKDINLTQKFLNDGANANRTICDYSGYPLRPLDISIGLNDSAITKALREKGALSSGGATQLGILLLFNRHDSLKELLQTDEYISTDRSLDLIFNSLNEAHWKSICDSLAGILQEGVHLDSIDFDWMRLLRNRKTDAEIPDKIKSFLLLLPKITMDEYVIADLPQQSELLDQLIQSDDFVERIKNLTVCQKQSLITDTSFTYRPIRKLLMETLVPGGEMGTSCYESIFSHYLPSLIERGDVRRFNEFIKWVPANLSEMKINLGFLFQDSITENHYDMIVALMARKMNIGFENETRYFNFSYVAANRHCGEYRDKLFAKMLEVVEKDKAVLDAALFLATDDRFIRTLVEKGADPQINVSEKIRRLSFERASTETISFILSKCSDLPGIEKVLPDITNKSHLLAIKNTMLKMPLLNTSVARISRDALQASRLNKLEDIRKAISCNAEIVTIHYSGGTKPTNLILANPMYYPSRTNDRVKSSIEKSQLIYPADNGELITSSTIDCAFSLVPFTAQRDMLSVYDVPMIKKGDKFYYKAISEFTIPKIEFDPKSSVFFPGVDMSFYVRDKASVITVSQNGKKTTVSKDKSFTVDLSNGDTQVKFENMEGFNVSSSVRMQCDYPYQSETFARYADDITADFTEKTRIQNYAKLYANSKYTGNVLEQKNKATSTNILSVKMYAEKYPRYIVDQLREAASRIADMDDNLNKFRQFYVLNKKITSQNTLDLQILFRQVDLSKIPDPNIRAKLVELKDKLQQNNREEEVMSKYLEIFSLQYFNDLSYEVQRYQGYVLELAQFMTDQELASEYAKSGISLSRLKSLILPAENIVTPATMNHRGAYLKTLISN